MRKCQMLSLICFLAVSCASTSLYSQYKRVTVQNSSQVFVSNSVAVSYAGLPPTELSFYSCGYGPYHIGNQVNFLGIVTPTSYTFSFSNPVTHVRLDFGLFYTNGVVTTAINGSQFALSASNLGLSNNMCDWNIAPSIVGGNVVAAPGPPITHKNSGLVTISVPSGINTATIAYAGPVIGSGHSGANISFYFGEIQAGNNGPVCAGSNIQLNGDSSITEPGSFCWTGPNGYWSNEQHPLITSLSKDDTGIYTLMYISGIDTLTDTTHVTLLPGPDQPMTTAYANPICKGETLQLTAASSPGANFQWNGPNGVNSSNASLSVSNVQEHHEGNYIVTATEYTCSLSDTLHVTVNHPVLHKFEEVACSNEGFEFNGRHLTASGSYADTLTGANGCDSISRLQLTILRSPELVATVDAIGKLCVGDTVSLSAMGGVSYNWYDRSGDLGSTFDVRTVLSELQNTVYLTGSGANNCPDTASVLIDAEPCCEISIPSAFTPNNDGRNDRFGALPSGNIRGYRMQIYNRWGQLVFVSYNVDDKWDGTFKGAPADMGVYHYNFSADCYEGGQMQNKGDITLLR